MKKIFVFLITTLLIVQSSILVYANETCIVRADEITIEKGNEELVPVYIESNTGLMGLKLSFEYDIEKVKVKSVSRGTITSKGNFVTNFGVKDTQFDVVWNNTSQIAEDGTLLVLSVEAQSNSQIKVSYSQPDTFNESYQDVNLNCNNIIVNVVDEETTQVSTGSETDIGNEETTEDIYVSNSQIIDAINIALEKYGFKTIEDVEESEAFFNFVNQTFETIFGTDQYNVSDLQTLKSLYYAAFEGEFITDVTSNIPSKDIAQSINNALDSMGVASIDELKADEQQEFIKLVESNLKSMNPDTPEISESVSTEKGIEIIGKLSDSVKNDTAQNDSGNTNLSEHKVLLYSLIGCALVIIAGVATFVVIRRHRRKNSGQNID